MRPIVRWSLVSIALSGLFVSGCASNTGTGALVGGAGGAGLGALIGSASGHAGAGAAIGAAAGGLTGAVVGNSVDAEEKRNRALIEARLGRSVAAGATTKEDVISMTQARVDETLILTHVQTHGMAVPLTASDLIILQQNGVSSRVVQAMQQAPPPQPATVIVQEEPRPVVVGGIYYGRPHHRPHYYW